MQTKRTTTRQRHAAILALLMLGLLARPARAAGPKPGRALPGGATPSGLAFRVNDESRIVGKVGDAAVFWPGPDQPPMIMAEGDAYPAGINSAGTVTGSYVRPNDQTVTHPFARRVFVWTPSTGFEDLGVFGVANAVNDAGMVVGSFERGALPVGHAHAFVWTRTTGFQDLGTLGGSISTAIDVNASGEVVGASHTASGQFHAFLWTAGRGMVDLGTLGGTPSFAWGINALGQIVGQSGTATGEFHAFLWSAAQGMVDVGTLGGTFSAARISDDGTIAGWSTTASGQSHAFVKTGNGPLIDLTPGARNATAFISRSGTIFGTIFGEPDGGGEADDLGFVWTPTEGLLGLQGLPADANSQGLIVGYSASRYGTTALTWSLSLKWDDALLTYGPLGWWGLGNAGTQWQQLHPLSPTAVASGQLDTNPVGDLVADFGPGFGVWVWANRQAWAQLLPLHADQIVVGDVDSNGQDDVVLSLPGLGLWARLNGATWIPLATASPTHMTFVRGADALAASFPGVGLWRATVVFGRLFWEPIDVREPSVLVDAGSALVAVYPGQGLWTYSLLDLFQRRCCGARLHAFDAARVAAGNLGGNFKGSDLVVDFGPAWGLWIYWSHLQSWTQLHHLSAVHASFADLDGKGGDEIVVDFGGAVGLWAYWPMTGFWQQLGPTLPIGGMIAGQLH